MKFKKLQKQNYELVFAPYHGYKNVDELMASMDAHNIDRQLACYINLEDSWYAVCMDGFSQYMVIGKDRIVSNIDPDTGSVTDIHSYPDDVLPYQPDRLDIGGPCNTQIAGELRQLYGSARCYYCKEDGTLTDCDTDNPIELLGYTMASSYYDYFTYCYVLLDYVNHEFFDYGDNPFRQDGVVLVNPFSGERLISNYNDNSNSIKRHFC